MNKTVLAITAVVALAATTAEAAPYGVKVKSANLSAVTTACKSTLDGSKSAVVLTSNANRQNFFYSTGTVVIPDACTTALAANGNTVLTAEEATKLAACFPATTTQLTIVPGPDQTYCPLPYGSTCDPTKPAIKFCQTVDLAGKECNVADDNSRCLFPVPQFVLQSYGVFPYHYDSRKIPATVANALQSAIRSHCPITGLSDYSYPIDKSGKTVILSYALPGDKTGCDVEKLATAVKNAVEEWNKTAAADMTYDVTGTYTVEAVEPKCFNKVNGKFLCKTTEGCTTPCADEADCTTNDDCGGICVAVGDSKDEKICWSNAVTSVVAPVIAAAFAIAFF